MDRCTKSAEQSRFHTEMSAAATEPDPTGEKKEEEFLREIKLVSTAPNAFKVELHRFELQTNLRTWTCTKRYSSLRDLYKNHGKRFSKPVQGLFPGKLSSGGGRHDRLQAFFAAARAELDPALHHTFITFFETWDEDVIEVGPGFWNFRGSFKLAGAPVQIGTQMSLVRLASGRFIVVDAIPLHPDVKATLDGLTEGGALIEAVVATHPFHTLALPKFHEAYPGARYYGCPRHLRILPQIPWAGDLSSCAVRDQWEPELRLALPAGAEFANPQPPSRNHFSAVWLYHPASRTLHVDDTIMIGANPGLMLRLAGYEHRRLRFHPSITSVGLHPGPDSPGLFREFVREVNTNWDIENIVAAHMGNCLGGCHEQLAALVDNEQYWAGLAKSKRSESPAEGFDNVQGDECG